MNEQFSAFLDNEATRDEADSVVNALLRDEALRASWSRQHWLRTTLRAHSAEAAVALDADFSTRVMQAIAADDRPETVASPPRVVPMRRGRRLVRRWRSAAGLAAVASAAGVVLLVSNPLRPDAASGTRSASTNSANTAPAAVRAQASAPSIATRGTVTGASMAAPTGSIGNDVVASTSATPVAGSTRQSVLTVNPKTQMRQAADHWSVSDPALADELNGYLDEHNGLARSYGLSGTTPALVRVATYGQVATK